MRDPHEGISDNGAITTGIRRDRVPPAFEVVLAEAVGEVPDQASLYLYGSVATGRARVPDSDVDLLGIGMSADVTRTLGVELSGRHRALCRDVAIAPARVDDFVGDGDEQYGNRVFLRHYCLHLVGPDHREDRVFPADARAARGFNGDIARHLDRWRTMLGERDTGMLGSAVGRKTLLAVAGLVSIHDGIWTTDRARAAERWVEIAPKSSVGMRRLYDWATGGATATVAELDEALDGVVVEVVEAFTANIGLWQQD